MCVLTCDIIGALSDTLFDATSDSLYSSALTHYYGIHTMNEHALAVLLDVAETQLSQYDDDTEYQSVIRQSIDKLQPLWIESVTHRLMTRDMGE